MHKAKAKIQVFLSNRGNRNLTFGCSLAVSFLCTSPFASSYLAARQERIEAHATAQQLKELKSSVVETHENLQLVQIAAEDLRKMNIDRTSVERLRNDIIEFVRQADCRLRNLTIGDGTQRPWMEDDDALSDGNDVFDSQFEAEPTPYALHTQILELDVSGNLGNIRTLLEAIQNIDRFMHTVSLDIHSETDANIRVQWELTLSSLVYTPIAEEDWE